MTQHNAVFTASLDPKAAKALQSWFKQVQVDITRFDSAHFTTTDIVIECIKAQFNVEIPKDVLVKIGFPEHDRFPVENVAIECVRNEDSPGLLHQVFEINYHPTEEKV